MMIGTQVLQLTIDRVFEVLHWRKEQRCGTYGNECRRQDELLGVEFTVVIGFVKNERVGLFGSL